MNQQTKTPSWIVRSAILAAALKAQDTADKKKEEPAAKAEAKK